MTKDGVKQAVRLDKFNTGNLEIVEENMCESKTATNFMNSTAKKPAATKTSSFAYGSSQKGSADSKKEKVFLPKPKPVVLEKQDCGGLTLDYKKLIERQKKKEKAKKLQRQKTIAL